jgi:hypothetical protein
VSSHWQASWMDCRAWALQHILPVPEVSALQAARRFSFQIRKSVAVADRGYLGLLCVVQQMQVQGRWAGSPGGTGI